MSIIRFFYWVGLVCGAVAMVSALIYVPSEFGITALSQLNSGAEGAFSVFGMVFIWVGFILLVAAVVMLAKNWSDLSSATKIVSVLGLLVGTFVGAYIFHWLFPKVIVETQAKNYTT